MTDENSLRRFAILIDPNNTSPRIAAVRFEEVAKSGDASVDVGRRLAMIRRAEDIMEQDPPLVSVAWENILDIWFNYVRGHNPKDYFGIYDVVRFDTYWLDKARQGPQCTPVATRLQSAFVPDGPERDVLAHAG